MWAAESGQPTHLKALIDRGANIAAKDRKGRTAENGAFHME